MLDKGYHVLKESKFLAPHLSLFLSLSVIRLLFLPPTFIRLRYPLLRLPRRLLFVRHGTVACEGVGMSLVGD